MAHVVVRSASQQRSLAGIDLFAGAEESARRDLERLCRWRWWAPGAVVLARDSFSQNVYFVTAGACRVEALAQTDKRAIVLDEIRAGGFFGELSAIDGEPRSATVVAVERTLTAELEGRLFTDFIATNPGVALKLMHRLTEILRQADMKIMELGGLDAPARICTELLRRARKGGGLPANVAVIRPIPRHHEIAARVSTSREMVARVLSGLTRRQLLRRDGNALFICDVDALSRLVVARS